MELVLEQPLRPPVTIALAMFSWSGIGKTALRLRKRRSDPAARTANRPASAASPAVLAAVLAYGLWLSFTQYAIPLALDHRKWVFAAVVLSAPAEWAMSRFGPRPYEQPNPRAVP